MELGILKNIENNISLYNFSYLEIKKRYFDILLFRASLRIPFFHNYSNCRSCRIYIYK